MSLSRLKRLFTPEACGLPADVLPADDIGRLVLKAHGAGDARDDRMDTLARSAVSGFDEEAARREDLTDIPFVTIDGADARDFDDAVHARPDGEGGFILKIAIADVAHYVPEGGELDRHARERGFSIYLADRAVPMLPERLSARHCSLLEGRRRLAVVIGLHIDAEGYPCAGPDIGRAVIRSHGRLTYGQVDAFLGGNADALPPALGPRIRNLHGAYDALSQAAADRGELSIERPKYIPRIDDNGFIDSFRVVHKLDARDMIEKMMVAANAACGDVLARAAGLSACFRAHDPAQPEQARRMTPEIRSMGLPLPHDGVWDNGYFNALQKEAAWKGLADSKIQDIVLGMIRRGHYTRVARAHTGLGVPCYATATSPIRRYPDLMNQRALLAAFGLTPRADRRTKPQETSMDSLVRHLNRREAAVERIHDDLLQRYGLALLARERGQAVPARILSHDSYGVTLGFQANPARIRIGADHLRFNALQAFAREATPLPPLEIRSVDIAAGQVSLGLERLAPGRTRDPEAKILTFPGQSVNCAPV